MVRSKQKITFAVVVRSILFNIIFFISTFLLLFTFLPFILFGKKSSLFIAYQWSKLTIFLLRVIAGITYEVRGWENLTPPCVVASKHQSAWETISYNVILKEASFVIKRELCWIPVYGWYLKSAGMIPINRSKKSQALRSVIRDSKRVLLEEKCPYLIIFPEGTRSLPNQQVPYQKGIAALYSALKAPVVPAAINSGCYWGRRKFFKFPGKIVVEFLPPIRPGLPLKEFMRLLEQNIEEASRKLIDGVPYASCSHSVPGQGVKTEV